MSTPEIQKTANHYKGWPQPKPDERLAQIKIFLADEDYHRTLRFTQKLSEIEEYVAFLEKNSYEYDKQLLKRIKEMIGVHENWINRATRRPSTYLGKRTTRYVHRNRLLALVKDRKRRERIARVKAPKLPPNLIPGPALHKCMEKADRPASPDPFLYTRQLAEVRRRQDAEAKKIMNSEQKAVLQPPIPHNFNGPYTSFCTLTSEDITERISIFSETLRRLHEAATAAPRPFIYEIISIITYSMQKGRDEAHQQFESHFKNKDLQLLLTLAEPSWNADVRRTMRDLSEDRSRESAIFAQLMALFNSDLWPGQNCDATLDDIFNRFKSDSEGEPITAADVEAFLVEMNEIGSIRYDVVSQVVQKPLFDKYPENGVPQELYRTAAQLFGYTVAHLENLLEDGKKSGIETFLRDTSSISSIKQRVETKFRLPTLASIPSQPQESTPNTEPAPGLLQKRIILEHHNNWNVRAPNFPNLWAFASLIENPKQFFALDRWPPDLQTQERRKEIWESGPPPLSPERNTDENFAHTKENETFYPGEKFFPFGETQYHEAVLGRQIELNGPNEATRRSSPSDPFALPELPESETPALMAYAARLGLCRRGRPLEDDNSSHATDTNASGLSTVTAEHMAASSYPTPEFSPETIGGVEMRVAETPAGRGPRRVTFNAPQVGKSSDSSSGLMRGFVRPVAEPGWFGSELRAKPGRNGGQGAGSGGSGTTGSGSVGGQRWIRRPKAASSSATRSSEGL